MKQDDIFTNPTPKNSKHEEFLIKGLKAYEKNLYSLSFHFFSKAVEFGNENAEYMLGRQYYYGQECRQSYHKVTKYYKKAADKRQKGGLYELARCCLYGLGVHKNERAAIRYLILSADYGNSTAQELLATRYLSKDEMKKACHYFALAADQGSVDSQYKMFELFKLGWVSQKTAIKNLKLAAEGGHPKAQRILGELYYYGDLGLPKDKKLAFYWCGCAAKQNDAEAAYCVALSYIDGDVVDKNSDLANYWLRIGANQNYPEARLALARALLREKTETSFKEAIEWLTRGATLGNSDCQKGLDLIEQVQKLGISYLDLDA